MQNDNVALELSDGLTCNRTPKTSMGSDGKGT